MYKAIVRISVFLFCTALLASCATQKPWQKGDQLFLQQQYDEAVYHYTNAVREQPETSEWKLKLSEAQQASAKQHLRLGEILTRQHKYREALLEYEKAALVVPEHRATLQKINSVKSLIFVSELLKKAQNQYHSQQHRKALETLETLLAYQPAHATALKLKGKIQEGLNALVDGFELDVTSTEPLTLQFNKTDIRKAFGILTQLSGIHFLFDEGVKSKQVTIHLERATFPQALDLLLHMNKLAKKVLNSKTIIIYPASKDKEKQYGEKIIQTFYLSNIRAKKAVELLRTMLKPRQIFIHGALNAVVLRGTPEVIELAKKILNTADREDSEVLFDLVLIEVNHNDILQFGPELNPYGISMGLGEAGKIVASGLSAGVATTNLVSSLSSLDSFFSLPTATFDLVKTLTDSDTLASPRIRVKNNKKAKVHIGAREPVITVTTTGETSTDSISYVDVGVKLTIEPIIHLNGTIETKMNLEVSSVTGRTSTANGSLALTISTTKADTVLTLQDGERTVIGGLIRNDKTSARKKIPFIGDIPFIGSLFTNYDNEKKKREILLSIVPHIVRRTDLPEINEMQMWSGNEDHLYTEPMFHSFKDSRYMIENDGKAETKPAMEIPQVKPAQTEAVIKETTVEETPLPAEEMPAAPQTMPVLPKN